MNPRSISTKKKTGYGSLTDFRSCWGMVTDPAFREAPLPGFSFTEPVPGAGQRKDAEDFRKNHRQRLRQRFMAGGAAAMPDYELLELILFRAIPRQDVKPLAKQLINAFGDFNRVIAASASALARVDGVGEAVISELKIVEAAAHRMARAKVLNRPVLSSWDALLGYCRTAMAHRETEQFRILFLDRKNVLIADEAQAEGSVDHVPAYPREIVRRALELNATALILVHNHPSGDPTPSEADLSLTGAIERAAGAIGIVIHDHLVIGKSAEFSFRAHGMLG